MNLIHYLYRHSWRLLLLAVLFGTLGGLASAGLVALVNQGLAAPAKLLTLGWAFFGLCATMLVAKLGAELALLHLTQSALLKLRIELSNKLLATPLKKLQALGKHRLLVILTDDINTFTAAFEWVPVLLVNAVVTLACFGYLAWLSWPLLALLGAFLLVGLLAFHLAEQRPLAHLARVREQKDVLYHNFRSLIEGSRELKLNARRGQDFVERVIGPDAQEFRRRFLAGMAGYALVANLGSLLFYLNLGVLLFVIPHWLDQPIEVLTGFTITLLYLVRPITDLMIALPLLRQANIALSKIRQLDAELAPNQAHADTIAFPNTSPLELQLQDVRHRYPGERDDHPFMLGPVDLTLRQGELVLVAGGNGSGKSTLAMLLLGLYAPEAGRILLNGQPVTEANRDAYRQHFSAVFADFHLFEQLLDADDPTQAAQAERYVDALGLAHKVRIRDGRFSTIELSSGQKKRLALVAAYLEDRPVYLFDEWAADQDPAFKRVFYTELLPELKARGKLVIAITHDDAYFHLADRLIRIENGQARELRAIEREQAEV